MCTWSDIIKWGKQELRNVELYVFFLTPFLMFYAIMQYHLRTSSNLPCIIAATLVFIVVLLYGVFKYLQVEYLKQHLKESSQKKKRHKKESK